MASGPWIGRINRSKTWPHPNGAVKHSHTHLLTERRPDRVDNGPSGECQPRWRIPTSEMKSDTYHLCQTHC
jgi:hypothetical protein